MDGRQGKTRRVCQVVMLAEGVNRWIGETALGWSVRGRALPAACLCCFYAANKFSVFTAFVSQTTDSGGTAVSDPHPGITTVST